jgi:hypothetical protein
VASVAKKYVLDPIQEGNIGWMRAADKFGYRRGPTQDSEWRPLKIVELSLPLAGIHIRR